jgi:hypothetical protein
VLYEDGLVWEGDDNYETMNDAMKALESGITIGVRHYEMVERKWELRELRPFKP